MKNSANEESIMISLIVPVYNIEEHFLRRCIESLISQTYKNIEIILVDDGSSGECPKICDSYAGIDSRIIVIHKDNGGTATARNAALKICKGDYICFVDGDDSLDTKILELIVQNIRSNVDIVWFDVIAELGTKEERWYNGKDDEIISFQKTLVKFLNNELIPSCWAKLISKKSVKGMFLNENLKRGQDEEYIIRILLGNGQSQLYHKAGYHYNIRSDGATKMNFSSKVFNIYDTVMLVKDEVLNKYPEMVQECNNYIATGFWNMVLQYIRSTVSTKSYEEKMISLLKKNRDVFWNCTLSSRQKGFLISTAIVGPEFMKKLYIIYKKMR